eukprot:3611605-Amphidinium_carterae.1
MTSFCHGGQCLPRTAKTHSKATQLAASCTSAHGHTRAHARARSRTNARTHRTVSVRVFLDKLS